MTKNEAAISGDVTQSLARLFAMLGFYMNVRLQMDLTLDTDPKVSKRQAEYERDAKANFRKLGEKLQHMSGDLDSQAFGFEFNDENVNSNRQTLAEIRAEIDLADDMLAALEINSNKSVDGDNLAG